MFAVAPNQPLTPDSTAIAVLVTERACTGATSVDDRLGPPEIRYTTAAVEVLYTATPLTGSGVVTCPGNPADHVTLHLDEPLGNRKLVDASTYPPRDATTNPFGG